MAKHACKTHRTPQECYDATTVFVAELCEAMEDLEEHMATCSNPDHWVERALMLHGKELLIGHLEDMEEKHEIRDN